MSDQPADSGINRFFQHVGLFQFASCLAGVFVFALLLRQGVSPPVIFLSMAGVFCLRFSLRPLVLLLARAVGLRGAMVTGTVLSCLQYLAIGRVEGVDGWLVAWVVATAAGDVIYWTLFHVIFASVGQQARLGRQTSLRQIISSAASIAGPPLGGLLLTWFPPVIAFSVAALLRVLSAIPLMGIPDPPFVREAPPDAYRAGRHAAAVFMTDGWVCCSSGIAWGMIAYVGLGQRYDTLGAAIATASLAGALAGVFLGRLVDFGRARQAVYLNVAAGVAINLIQAAAGYEPARIVGGMLAAALLGGLAAPSIMPAVYIAVQAAPCTLRAQIAAEGGWDCGAVLATLCCAALTWLGAPLQAGILLAIPALFVQSWLLVHLYGSGAKARPGGEALAPGD